MKRRWIGVAVAVALALATACGGSADLDPSEQQSSDEAETAGMVLDASLTYTHGAAGYPVAHARCFGKMAAPDSEVEVETQLYDDDYNIFVCGSSATDCAPEGTGWIDKTVTLTAYVNDWGIRPMLHYHTYCRGRYMKGSRWTAWKVRNTPSKIAE